MLLPTSGWDSAPFFDVVHSQREQGVPGDVLARRLNFISQSGVVHYSSLLVYKRAPLRTGMWTRPPSSCVHRERQPRQSRIVSPREREGVAGHVEACMLDGPVAACRSWARHTLLQVGATRRQGSINVCYIPQSRNVCVSPVLLYIDLGYSDFVAASPS